MRLKKKNIKNNFIFQSLYQVITTLVPFIVIPFITRNIGETDLGNFSYVNSIAALFVVGANLGIARYGQRLIASHSGDVEQQKKDYSSLFIDHCLSSFIALIVFFALSLTIWSGDDQYLYFLCSCTIFSALFDVTWLFYGLQNVKPVVIINLCVKLIEEILLLILVHTKHAFFWYILLTSAFSLSCNVILFLLSVKALGFSKPEFKDCVRHWKPLFVLMIAVVASTLYTTFDKTIIGLFLPKEEVTFYEFADKILSIPKYLINVVGVVLFPKICELLSGNKISEANKYRSVALEIVTMLCIGSGFGLLAIGPKLVIAYYGENYGPCATYLMMMTPLIYIILIGDVFRTLYLIPEKKDNKYVISTCIGSLSNLLLSFVLVQYIDTFGVIIGSISAEVIGTLLQYFFVRKEVPLKKIMIPFLFFLFDGGLMYGVIYLLSLMKINDILFIVIGVIVGLIVYLLISLLYFMVLSKNKQFYRNYVEHLFFKR